jgi:uncharacterized membrane protein
MLFHGNMLYGKIHHKYLVFPPAGVMRLTHSLSLDLCREIDLGDVMHSVQYEASIVVYSLVTGLPLLMTYSSSYEGESSDKLSWKSTALLCFASVLLCSALLCFALLACVWCVCVCVCVCVSVCVCVCASRGTSSGLAGEKLEGVVEEMQCRAKAKADYAALQVFLFGRENADTVDPPALEKFIEGVFVPTNNYYVRCWVQWPRSE